MTQVAVLGTGIMGAAMARALLRARLPVSVWDRSPQVTAQLAQDGAEAAGSAAEAVRGADVVITMLPTPAVVESVMFGHIEGGPMDAPIADAKLHKIASGDYAPEFPLEWALKDVDLALAAGGEGGLPLMTALSGQWHAAVSAGHGREDVSAARLALADQR